MKCWKESQSNYYGVGSEFPYDPKTMMYELEKSDIINVIEKRFDLTPEDYNEKITHTFYCESYDYEFDTEFVPSEYLSKDEYLGLLEIEN
jgi:hypothetical protein